MATLEKTADWDIVEVPSSIDMVEFSVEAFYASFLNFTTKEEYLANRNSWKQIYSAISYEIRETKNEFRDRMSLNDVVMYRMMKARPGATQDEIRQTEEFSIRTSIQFGSGDSPMILSRELLTLRADARRMMEILGEMKQQAAQQSQARFTA